MLGRLIDHAALTVLGTVGLYLFFLNAGLGIPASCGLTLACAALARYVIVNRPRKERITRTRAEASLLSIAMMDGDAARAALAELSGIDDGIFLIRHPEGTVTVDEVFAIWRERGDGTAIVTTCKVDDAAKSFAKASNMTVMDRDWLIRAIRRTSRYAVEEPPREAVSAQLSRLWAGVRVRPRMLLYSVSLMGMYLATGRLICLACALFVLGVAGAKLIEGYVQ